MNKEDKNFNYKKLHPFKWFILENYPFLEDSIDVLTNYQLFCKLGEMYNKQVDAINTLGIQVEGITDWFDDLDVQEEVNNKLDDMAESGELEEIIAAYINTNALICFDTVNDMKSSENLVDGSYSKTLGYHSKNDGGGAIYKIREITNQDIVDEKLIIALSDENLIAELIPSIVYPETIGCVVDGINDNSPEINALLEIAVEKNYKIGFHNEYYLTNSIALPDQLAIDFNNTKFIALENINMLSCSLVDSNVQNLKISNLILDLNEIASKGIYLNSCWRRTFENINIINVPSSGIAIHIDTGKGGGNLFENIRGTSVDNNTATFIKIQSDDNTINNCDYQNFSIGIDLQGFARVFNFHGYINNSTTYDSSYFIKISNNGRIFADNLYPDTQKTVFYATSVQPCQLGNIYYNFNNNIIDNTSCKIFDSDNGQRFYRTYVNNLVLSIPNTITPTIITPNHTGLNDAMITINNVVGTADKNYERPFKYIKVEIDSSNFTNLGVINDNCVLLGSCPNSVTSSNKLLAQTNIYCSFKLLNGYYHFIGFGGANSDEQYDGTCYVNDNKVYILPHAKQGANFKFNIIVPVINNSFNT